MLQTLASGPDPTSTLLLLLGSSAYLLLGILHKVPPCAPRSCASHQLPGFAAQAGFIFRFPGRHVWLVQQLGLLEGLHEGAPAER